MEPLPDNNRVWRWLNTGEPGALTLADSAMPLLDDEDILIENKAIGLNPVDWKLIDWGFKSWNKGHVPGVDGAGVIVAAGQNVKMPIGTRVVYHQALSRDGSFAQYTAIQAKSVFVIPEGLSFSVAASLPCPALTAYQALDKIPLKANRDLLVTGAGGSVGMILSQLAIKAGYRVWVTASPNHRDRLLALGVSGVFDYHHAGWIDELKQTIGSRQLYAIVDTISGEHANQLAASIGYNGHLVCVQDRIETNPLEAFTTGVSLHEVALNSIFDHGTNQDWQDWKAAGAQLLESVVSGRLEIPAIETGSFDQLPEQLSLLREGKRKAKQIVTF